MGHVHHLPDGDLQDARDRELRLEVQTDGPRFRWLDPDFQGWLLGYDGRLEVEKAWEARSKARNQHVSVTGPDSH